MSKIYFDSNSIKNIILPDLAHTKKSIDQILQSISNIQTSAGKSSINRCLGILKESSNELNQINQWLVKSNNIWIQTIETMNDSVCHWKHNVIVRRNSNIK